MTYNANKAFAESMKAAGIGGLSGKPTTSAAKSIQDRFREQTQKDSGSTYDEIALPSEKKIDQKISGLGGKKPTKDDRNLDQKIFDGMMYYGAKFLGLDKPDPRDDDMFILDAYNSDPMFVIPDPIPVTESGINTGTYDFIDMSKLASGPSQPKTQPNMDTAPQIGDVDDTPVTTPKVPSLMTPPTMEGVPNIPDETKTADYTIQSGDTLSQIAKATGSTVKELMAINNIKNKNKIFAGADIKIPIYRKGDAEVVKSATSMKELEPIKASYNLALALPPLKPDVSADTYESPDEMSDLEILARTIHAEAKGESDKGKLAVGAVIANRVKAQSWMGKNLREVILKPTQFSPWNSWTGGAKGEQGKDMLGVSAKPSEESYEAARKILSGEYEDPTKGATHFLNPKVSKPNWYGKFVKNDPLKIGKHQFGSPDDPFWKFRGIDVSLEKSLRPKVRPKGLGAK
tara:strand:- start:10 stop:1386 length:1377 start_codon:yes stop_codon:yes gene_type:complete